MLNSIVYAQPLSQEYLDCSKVNCCDLMAHLIDWRGISGLIFFFFCTSEREGGRDMQAGRLGEERTEEGRVQPLNRVEGDVL